MNILSPEGLFTRDLPTGNLVWVDQVNGNDSLAVRGQRGVPFKTLTAAKNAAQAGDTIMVLPGTYDENDLLRDQVNWYFFPGALVHYTDTQAGAIFDTGSSAVTSCIAGLGEFQSDNTEVVVFSSPGSDVRIEARRMMADAATCVHVYAQSDCLRLVVAEKIEGVVGINMNGGSTCRCIVDADEVCGTASYGVLYSGGELLHVTARRLSAWSNVVQLTDGTGEVIIDASEITVDDDVSAVVYGASAPKLVIRNARIKSANADAVSIGENGSNKVQLMSCVGIAGNAHSIYATNANTLVQIPGGWASNRDVHSNVSLIGGFIAPNTNIW